MRAHKTATEKEANDLLTKISSRMGYPVDGVQIGDGHRGLVGQGKTLRPVDTFETADGWAVPLPNDVLAAAEGGGIAVVAKEAEPKAPGGPPGSK